MEAEVELIQNNNLPLYVSEGKWQTNLQSIENNKYLHFYYNALQQLSGDLTIFGRSSDESTDYHIIWAINDSNVENLAFGIYTISDKKFNRNKVKNNFLKNKYTYLIL